MADNVTLNPGTGGSVIATDEISSVHYQRMKMTYGPDGTATDVSDSTPLPVESAYGLPFARRLDTAGDGTGTKNATGDYSGAADDFYLEAAGSNYYVERLRVYIRDESSPAIFSSEGYAATTALSNGISITVEDGGSPDLVDLTDGSPITTNADWARFGTLEFPGFTSGDGVMVVDIVFHRPIRLRASESEKLVVELNDDFTSLQEHSFTAIGYTL